MWEFLKADLESRNLWSSTYLLTVQGLVESAVRLQQITAAIDRDGLMVPRYNAKGEQIGEQAHPLLTMQHVFQTQVLKHIERLGMSPKDIVFLTQTDPADDNVINADSVTVKKGINYFR